VTITTLRTVVSPVTSNTTMWFVGLGLDMSVVVSTRPLEFVRYVVRFRTITPRAAGRRYIRNNLPTVLHLMDDGAHEPDDLVSHNCHNQYKPQNVRRSMKKQVVRLNTKIRIVR
jgi:Zn-dependent alcohol dehydrogenase